MYVTVVGAGVGVGSGDGIGFGSGIGVGFGSGMAGAGFASLKYFGAGMASDVVLDGGIGSSSYNSGSGNANHMWFLNTKYLMFRPHKDRNFVPIGGDRQAVNQDAKPTIH